MSDIIDNQAENAQPEQPQEAPVINIHTQYLKDFSFENPNAPDSLRTNEQPDVNVKVDIQAKKLNENEPLYEVALDVTAEAKREDTVLFMTQAVYAGVFTIKVQPELVRPSLMIECPRLLFPFARQIVADAVRNGGFPPLMLQPVDFVAIYRQDMERRRQEQGAASEEGAPAADA